MIGSNDHLTAIRRRERAPSTTSKGEPVMDRWLEYDLVALAMLVLGIATVELLAFSL